LLLDALAHADAIWLNTNDLLAEVERRTGERLPAPSIRPILTQLKIEGTIVRKKRLIAMADRSKKGNAQQRRQ
jgi:hypothetical protein